MKRIEVAVGIIQNEKAQVLINQRIVKDRYFRKWEFPGGKLELGETAQQALNRELEEELGIFVESSKELMLLEHDYSDRKVRLHVLYVIKYSGEPQGKEGQAIRWSELSQLSDFDFLAGNKAIIDTLKNLQK